MLKLGQNVLNKIQDLILEIDRPKSPINQHRRQKNQLFISNEHSECIKSPSKSPLGKKLYDQAKQKQTKIYQQEKQRIYVEAAELKNFKVTNKHSVFLNSRNQRKPIYQRMYQIVQEKKQKQQLNKLKSEFQKKKLEQYKKSKKASAQEVKRIIQGLDRKQKQRLQRINMQKIEKMRKTALQSSQKPKLTKQSQKIWEKKLIKRSLSTNVIQRFEQYGWQKKNNEQKHRQQIRAKQTPFKPKITENSRIIASRVSRSPLGSDLSRSTSCKCLKRQQNVEKCLQASQKKHYFMGSSNSRYNHNQKSISTYENSSRYLGQSLLRKKQYRNRINVSEYPNYDGQYDS